LESTRPGIGSRIELERAEREHRVGLLPLLGREAERVGAARRPAGVRDQDVDGSELGSDTLDQRRRRVGVGRVVHEAGAADLGRRGLDALLRRRCQRDVRALGGERRGDRLADPLRRAGDERDPPTDPQLHAREPILACDQGG
jgi:hypothetical protein